MTPLKCDEKNERCRLEDSFSFPENQRVYPDDEYCLARDRMLIEKLHAINIEEEYRQLVDEATSWKDFSG
jgi:hypothetical protein